MKIKTIENRGKIISGIALLLIAGIIWTGGYRVDTLNQENKILVNQNEHFRLELETPDKRDEEIAKLKKEITGLNQAYEQITIKYMADELYIPDLEKRYRNLYLYALYAQEILVANGIEFRMVEGGLDYKALLGEEK